MKRIAIALLLVCSSVQAQTLTVVDTAGLQGTYLLTVQGGNVTVVPIQIVRPGPVPPVVVPPVVPTTNLTEAVRHATAAILPYPNKDMHRRAIAESIKFVSGFVGGATVTEARALVKQACNLAVGADESKWLMWWLAVDLQLDSMNVTPASYAAALKEISAELVRDLPASNVGERALPPEVWQAILKLLVELIAKWMEARL